MASDWQTTDYFTDESLIEDPYPYLEQLRAECPVLAARPPRRGGRDRLRRGQRGLPRHRHVLVVQLGDRARSPRSPCRSRATTSARSSTSTATRCRCSSTWSRWTRPTTRRERALLMRLITPKRLKDNEAFMWRPRRPPARRVPRRRPLRVHRGLRAAVRHAGRGRPPRRARGGPPALPGGLRPHARAPAGRARATSTADPARTRWPGSTSYFADYIEDRRREPPQGRAHRPRPRHLPRRHHARGRRGRAHGHVPLRRRPGDHRPPAGRRPQAPRRAPRAAGRAARRTSDQIPNFIEEALRIESPVKTDFRMTTQSTDRRRRRHQGRHAGDAAQRRRQPRPAPLRVPGRVPRRPRERPVPHRLRPRRALLPRRAAGPGRGPHQHRAHPRPHPQHPPVRGAPRSRRATAASHYEPTWILRGLTNLHLEFDTVEASK